ncbi:MAG: alpha/beta hydrolase, partial [Longicatena sp.]|nr:alpha/beta hydrolase [Longicatena sp.]
LNEIKCPVLVLGGEKDKIITSRASVEIANKLGCEIYMYAQYGHAVYEEAKDFNQRIYQFLAK